MHFRIGMPPTGRYRISESTVWCMMMTDSPAIRDVLLFPTMKSQNLRIV